MKQSTSKWYEPEDLNRYNRVPNYKKLLNFSDIDSRYQFKRPSFPRKTDRFADQLTIDTSDNFETQDKQIKPSGNNDEQDEPVKIQSDNDDEWNTKQTDSNNFQNAMNIERINQIVDFEIRNRSKGRVLENEKDEDIETIKDNFVKSIFVNSFDENNNCGQHQCKMDIKVMNSQYRSEEQCSADQTNKKDLINDDKRSSASTPQMKPRTTNYCAHHTVNLDPIELKLHENIESEFEKFTPRKLFEMPTSSNQLMFLLPIVINPAAAEEISINFSNFKAPKTQQNKFNFK